MRRRAWVAVLLACLAPGGLLAAGIAVDKAWSWPLPPVSRVGAAYLQIRNAGAEPDRLVGARTEAAVRAEIHTHIMDGGMMHMREVEGVVIPAGETVVFEPHGLHLMLFELAQPFAEGLTYEVVLVFERAGEVSVTVQVTATPPGD